MTHSEGTMQTRCSSGFGVAALLGALSAITLLIAWPQSTQSYERTKTCGTYGSPSCDAGETGCPLYWRSRTLGYHIKEAPSLAFPEGSSPDSSTRFPPELERAITTSFETWHDPSDCSELGFTFRGYTTEGIDVNNAGAQDNTNVVVWRDAGWDRQSSVLALTFTSYDDQGDGRGEIVDADMVINADDFNFDTLEQSRPAGGVADVRNTVVHEVGHFIGLAHSDVEDATMYESASVGEIKKRTLHPDDIAGLCAAYPQGNMGEHCPLESSADSSNDDGCAGCASTTDEGLPVGKTLFVALALLTVGLRRSRPWSVGR